MTKQILVSDLGREDLEKRAFGVMYSTRCLVPGEAHGVWQIVLNHCAKSVKAQVDQVISSRS